MRRSIIYIALVGAFSLIFSSCNKDDDLNHVTGEVELYLLESYQTIESTCRIDESTMITEERPVIKYDDFISYDSKNYIFNISDESKEAVDNLEHSVYGLAFAIKADNRLIYSGYFWPGYSSLSCDWIVIDPLTLGNGNELSVELGYPGPIEGVEIPDKRNNCLILNIFRRDNKLIE